MSTTKQKNKKTRETKDSKSRIGGIGSRIAQASESKNLTQEALASKLGVTRQTVTNWTNGKSEPSLFLLKKIKDVCGVTYDFLLDGNEISDYELYQQIKNLSHKEKMVLKFFLESVSKLV